MSFMAGNYLEYGLHRLEGGEIVMRLIREYVSHH
jgi:hypothetical protein